MSLTGLSDIVGQLSFVQQQQKKNPNIYTDLFTQTSYCPPLFTLIGLKWNQL